MIVGIIGDKYYMEDDKKTLRFEFYATAEVYEKIQQIIEEDNGKTK